MVNNKQFYTLIFILTTFFVSHAQSNGGAQEAIQLRNNLDNYLKQNIGDKPITLKEKWMASKIDSLLEITQLQSQKIDQLTKQNIGSNSSSSKDNAILYTVYFKSDAFQLSPTEKTKLEEFLKANPPSNFIIKGYTDAYGSDAHNLQLAMNRARQVKAFIQGKQANASLEVLACQSNPNAIQPQAHLYRKVEILLP